MSFENGEHDDMDNLDWIAFIDEYHCPDYWQDMDEYDPNDDPCCGADDWDDDDDEDDTCSDKSGAD
jgi:hypothetical protein